MARNILTREQAEIAIVESGIIGFDELRHRYCTWHAIDHIYEGSWQRPLALALDEVSVSYAPNGNEITPILSDTVACEACAKEREQ